MALLKEYIQIYFRAGRTQEQNAYESERPESDALTIADLDAIERFISAAVTVEIEKQKSKVTSA